MYVKKYLLFFSLPLGRFKIIERKLLCLNESRLQSKKFSLKKKLIIIVDKKEEMANNE